MLKSIINLTALSRIRLSLWGSRLILATLVLLFSATALNAQIKAGFTADTTSGCSPLAVQFKDLSTGTITKRTWIFGNGNSSGIKNPKAQYSTPGKYTVTLIVSDGSKSDTLIRTKYITVFANPVANFAALPPTKGCHPFTVTFKDSSARGDTVINKWIWDFGDGTTSTVQSPIHTFGLAGSFPISLQTTDANKCGNAKVISNYIDVSDPPKAEFSSSSVLEACAPPLTVNFSNASAGAGAISYLWDFGDGSTSTAKEPSHTYTKYGIFSVKLVVTDPNGCSVTSLKKDYVKIIHVVSGYSTSKKIGCSNDSIKFTNTSTGATSYAWTFGDGTTSTQANPIRVYPIPGKYPISLTASNGALCKDVFRDTITVEKIVAKFSSDKHFGCITPMTVKYSDASENAASWEWRFGNRIKSFTQNPSNTFDTAVINTSPPFQRYYVYNTWMRYTDTLIATSPNGCKDTAILPNNVKIYITRPFLVADKLKGCAPLAVQFTDKSTPPDSVKSWKWTFGDGNTSTLQHPSNTFIKDQAYSVNMQITSMSGCVLDTTFIVKAGTKPTADFTVNKKKVCASESLFFTDLSTPADKVDEWKWAFGDGGGMTKQHPEYYYTDTGYMNVELITGYHGCYDTIVKPNFVYINGPILKMSTTHDCMNPLAYQFRDTMKAAHRWVWNFGDGSSLDSTNRNVLHTFPATIPGQNYNVRLVAFNDSNGCSFVSEKLIAARQIKAAITLNPSAGCVPLNVLANGTPSQDEGSYAWQWGDGTSDDFSAIQAHTYKTAGRFRLRLIAADVNGCKDTTEKLVSAFKPNADFTLDTLNGCVPATFKFTNTTSSDTTVAQWFWSFGDGGFSQDKTPSFTYLKSGTKAVSLIVRDTLGCLDTAVVKNIKVTEPKADFIGNGDRQLCAGESQSFSNLSSGLNLVHYKWKFGDGDSLITTSLTHPSHIYKNPGTYTVSLSIRESNGCESSKTAIAYIDVQAIPVPEFFADTLASNCYPLLVSFTDTTDTKPIQSWLWDFGDNKAGSNIPNPKHNYTLPGTYSVTLNLTSTYGCKKTLEKKEYIKIGGPYAEFTLFPDSICKGEQVTFTVKNENSYVYSYRWDFGDGEEGSGKSTKHIYNQVGLLFPQLIYYDFDSACAKYANNEIFIQEVVADFSLDKLFGCMPLDVKATDLSTGASKWNWAFGNGTKQGIQNPLATTFPFSGKFPVQLAIENNQGCKDTAVKQIRVDPLPQVTVTKDLLICKGDNTQLIANGGVRYQWTPKETLNNDSIYNPVATPDVNTVYTVSVTDTNTCRASAKITVTVQQPPVVALKDTTIIIGEVVRINAEAGAGFSYHWAPPKGLSCVTCPNPKAQPLDSTLYTVTITDANNCFNTQRSMYIRVRAEYSVDVPKAFTPNGDNYNDVIYVRGWGIKQLHYFRIYNRWGQLVFESNDIKSGWDGYFRGQLQNMETYVYVVSALMFDDKTFTNRGNISLLR